MSSTEARQLVALQLLPAAAAMRSSSWRRPSSWRPSGVCIRSAVRPQAGVQISVVERSSAISPGAPASRSNPVLGAVPG